MGNYSRDRLPLELPIPRPQTPNPKPETRNPKPETLNPIPYSLNHSSFRFLRSAPSTRWASSVSLTLDSGVYVTNFHSKLLKVNCVQVS
ncbi:hypothetical protein T484DRAFT_1634107 [Baffinella frigidus]|nr:hypothetical protein T484DRAFT_1634107 [Cryptophyta sp. CCMP2293]